MILRGVNICYALLLASMIISVTTLVAPKKMVRFVDLEHVNITYYNPKYYKYVHFKSQRKRRGDPQHYLTGAFESLYALGNNSTVDIYVYEFLSNEYRRSFVEMHGHLCDLLFKNILIGPLFSEHLQLQMCPMPAKAYCFKDMYIPNLPLLATFPFQKGRVFVNISLDNGEILATGFLDAVIMTRFV